ncbi:MAG: FKBP-type peptidylprolyl isomerase [Deltaproteobacteria bacterium]|nr:MAG: FKBP-type peptidylprolyl isomerase [Deltaproteobacteria bacterium]TMQ16484.1 MAG: FKBP-type peptidylprolyl isomerase [Deltaproteobacteria bacterium]
MRGFVLLLTVSGGLACKRAPEDKSPVHTDTPAPGPTANVGSGAVHSPQVAPPVDLKAPPPDAIKTASGLAIKKLSSNASGAQPRRNDTVMVTFTGWHQKTGETFYTSQGGGQPMPLNLSQSAPGFVEALQQLHVGEKAVVWIPRDIGFKEATPADERDERVYLFDVLDVRPAPPVPEDVAKPPDKALTLKSGIKYVVLRPGTGKDTVRPYDSTAFVYTFWDHDGRMLETKEARERPKAAQPVHQAPGMTEMLTAMTVGERVRFWVDAEKMVQFGKKPGGVEHGLLCYELEVRQNTKAEHEPPPTPPDVAKPPADTRKTPKGVFYKVIIAGPGKDPRHPSENDTVKVNYTGWTTDGKMFDSSFLTGQPATFNLHGVIAGWTDGIPVMTTGDHVRFWIPEELAYKGQAGKPQGMLVFDVELLEIVSPTNH